MGLVLIRLLTILPVTSSRGYTDAIIKIYQHSGVINGLLNQVEQGPTHQQGKATTDMSSFYPDLPFNYWLMCSLSMNN